jgi:hypothetical protein
MMRKWSWLLISLAAAWSSGSTERWKGKGIYALLGSARHLSQGRRQLAGRCRRLHRTGSRSSSRSRSCREKADSVSYTTADGKGLSRHDYKVVGRERIRTPAGKFDPVKVARQSDDRETAELWFAAERAFIPVRLLVVEKDGTATSGR